MLTSQEAYQRVLAIVDRYHMLLNDFTNFQRDIEHLNSKPYAALHLSVKKNSDTTSRVHFIGQDYTICFAMVPHDGNYCGHITLHRGGEPNTKNQLASALFDSAGSIYCGYEEDGHRKRITNANDCVQLVLNWLTLAV